MPFILYKYRHGFNQDWILGCNTT